MKIGGRGILIEFDEGVMRLVDEEVKLAAKEAGKSIPRLKVINQLIAEALEARATSRGEEVPRAEPVVLTPEYVLQFETLGEAKQAACYLKEPPAFFEPILIDSKDLTRDGLTRHLHNPSPSFLGKDGIEVRVITEIRSVPLPTAHSSLVAAGHFSEDPQTPGEERIERLADRTQED